MDDTMVSPVTVCQTQRERVGHVDAAGSDDRHVKVPTCLSPTVKAMFPAVKEGISTWWSANGTSNLLILSLRQKRKEKEGNDFLRSRDVKWDESLRPPDGVRAVAVDVVHGRLRLQGAGVDPEEDQRTTLLVMENLEGQGAQVVLVPAAEE